ncbi:MAG: hypothetical protein FWD35_00695, partial [Oscillospiraceae bacterium]|nr:hypothetical protein [Oscillospiraceae bacterium]
MKTNDSVKERRLLEKELGVLAKSHKGFRVHVNAKGVPLLGAAIAALPEITDESVCVCISELAEAVSLTSMDIDSFCASAKFAAIDFAFRTNEPSVFDDCYGKLGALALLDIERIRSEFNPLDRVFESDALYPRLTHESRALYRKMTAELAAFMNLSETELSQDYVRTARKASEKSDSSVTIGEVIGADYRHAFPNMNPARYIAMLFAGAAMLALIAGILSGNLWLALLVFLPAFACVKPIADLSVSKTSRIKIPLPQIELRGEIPASAKTLCVISTLLTSPRDTDLITAKLDMARLKNTSGNLRFAVLCDLKANKYNSVSPDDDALIEAVRQKFAGSGYVALIRKREYSSTSRCYQGRERKRGAIEALLKYLRRESYPEAGTAFKAIIGDKTALENIKYVCALDYDTVPLMDSIAELVGIAEYPTHSRTGIIAPRMTTSLTSSLKTAFSRAMVGNGGCAGASSYDSFAGEFYQDCFGEGIFAGKGLINVNVFLERCLNQFE